VAPILAGLLVPLACSGSALDPRASASDGLVYVRLAGGSQELARARIGDGALRPVTHTPERQESWPYWSSRARRIVFQVERSDGTMDLVLLDPETGAEEPAADDAERDERWPAWSPRSGRLAYAVRGGRPPGGIALAEIGAQTRIVARAGGRDLFLRPSWAPDGERLVSQRRADTGDGSTLWLVTRDAPPRALTDDAAWIDTKPGFTRDGSTVVYSRRPAGGGAREVATVASTGGPPRALPLGPGDHHSASPSPTRDEIALVTERDGRSRILLVDGSGETIRGLRGPEGRDAFAPRWSPDGERLVVTTTPAGRGAPRLVDASSLAETRTAVLDREGRVLLDTPGLMADWMPPWR
jgi:Tol biopolymer transport system component